MCMYLLLLSLNWVTKTDCIVLMFAVCLLGLCCGLVCIGLVWFDCVLLCLYFRCESFWVCLNWCVWCFMWFDYLYFILVCSLLLLFCLLCLFIFAFEYCLGILTLLLCFEFIWFYLFVVLRFVICFGVFTCCVCVLLFAYCVNVWSGKLVCSDVLGLMCLRTCY